MMFDQLAHPTLNDPHIYIFLFKITFVNICCDDLKVKEMPTVLKSKYYLKQHLKHGLFSDEVVKCKYNKNL